MRYRISVILLGMCLLLLAGCSSAEQCKFAETIELTGEHWNVTEHIGRAFSMGIVGDYLYLRNDWEDTKLTLINMSDKGDIYNFGKRGSGPNELLDPGPSIFHGNTIDVFDGSKMALLRYDVNRVVSGDSLGNVTSFRTNLPGIISLVKLSDSCYVASGVFQEGRLCLLDKGGKVCAYAGSYPVSDNLAEAPFHVLGVAYQSSMCVQPMGRRTALATRYGDVLQIYEWDLLNNTAKEICCMNEFSPRLTTKDINGTPNFRPDRETRWGYLAIAATDKYIFALYSGQLQIEENTFYLGDEIHVFDWDGNPCYLLHLDCKASSLAVKGDKLFVLAEYDNVGNDIAEYDLLLK